MLNKQTQESLLAKVAEGDRQARESLFSHYLPIVRNLVRLRIDDCLSSRINPSDIVQETMVELAMRLEDFVQRRPMPFDAWVRRTAYQNLARIHRMHLQVESRNARREVSLSRAGSRQIALGLDFTSDNPVAKMVQEELVQQVQQAMNALSDADRELILMRTCEGVDNATAAAVLDMEPRLCSKRYARALLKLRQLLRPGGDDPAGFKATGSHDQDL